MAKSQKERDDDLKGRRAKFAEKELRHRVRPGIEMAVQRIQGRADKISVSELLQIAILKMDLMSDEELTSFLKYPRHDVLVSDEVARAIYDHGVRSMMNNPDQDPSDEIERPAA